MVCSSGRLSGRVVLGARTSTAKWPNLPSWCCTINWVRPSLSRSTCTGSHSDAVSPHAQGAPVWQGCSQHLKRDIGTLAEQDFSLGAVTRLQGLVGDPVLLDLGGVLVDGIGQLLRRWAAVVAVVPVQKESKITFSQTNLMGDIEHIGMHAPTLQRARAALTKAVSACCSPERDSVRYCTALSLRPARTAGIELLPKMRGGSLDAKVFVGATRVVAGCEDEASICLASTARPDHC